MKKLLSLFLLATAFIMVYAEETLTVGSSAGATIEINAAGDYLLQGDGTTCTQQIIVAADLGTVNLTLDNVNVEVTGDKNSGTSAFIVNTGTTAVIAFKGTNTVKSNCDSGTGIEAMGNIVLNGEADAVLNCASKGWAAAIGSTAYPSTKTLASGDITINSGIINATADWETPGIGSSINCLAHNITINGGQITSKAGAQGAGIGSGYSQWGESKGTGTITINGGTVMAYAGCSESTWGATDSYMPLGVPKGSNCTIDVIIKGGSVLALRSDGSEYTANPVAATDGNGTDIVLFKTQLAGVSAATRVYSGTVGTLTLGEGGYGMNDVYTTADGWLYLYLPKQADGVSVTLNTDNGTSAVEQTSVLTVSVRGAAGSIDIMNAAGQTVNIFDLSGRQVLTTVADNNLYSMPFEAGMYIVRVAGKGHKVIVR